MKRWNVGRKLLTKTAAIIGLMIVVVVVAVTGLDSLGDSIASLAGPHTKTLVLAGDINASTADMISAERGIGKGGAHRVMVDAEVGGDRADLPVLAVVEAANLRALFGRDHGGPLRTRDGSASAVEGATRFRGRRPCIATRPPEARSAIDPSTCQRAVCRVAWGCGKTDPSRACDTRAGDPDDRGVLPGCADGAAARTEAARAAARQADEQ